MEPTVQESLSADIHLLATLLGRVILRVAGSACFDLEEQVRVQAKDLRTTHSLAGTRQLCIQLERLDLPDLRMLIRAFTVYFDLVNLAEQQARVRALRLRASQQYPQPVADSVAAALQRLRE